MTHSRFYAYCRNQMGSSGFIGQTLMVTENTLETEISGTVISAASDGFRLDRQ